MKQQTIVNARAKLAATLPSTTEILRGSLLHRRIRHRSGCAVCARGKGHLVWVLTVSYPGGRNKQISLSAEQKPMVQQWLRNYRKLKATLERICELNQQLLRPENKYRGSESRLGPTGCKRPSTRLAGFGDLFDNLRPALRPTLCARSAARLLGIPRIWDEKFVDNPDVW